MSEDLRLEPWDDSALAFERRANVPEMKLHLGGVEPDQALLDRHERVRAIVEGGRGSMFLVRLAGEPDPVGSIGYWEREWQGEAVYETGWKVLPGFQGRGLAVAATVAARGHAAAHGRRRWLHAFPKVSNAASNGVCRRAGFELRGESDFEYPPGHPIVVHDWRYDLRADPSWPTGLTASDS
ncbi:GNAT family N-acetyltransferase [Actinoplanes sp. NPDC049599]|jgi:RimJ/RimL family protein N-acetyltransferase|uniref:GNAT family N-acetyltransferase n=1 Tax=Actinoplanes sp. NPDC049599 TaxID=3363903 RepID=UPI0037AAC5F4